MMTNSTYLYMPFLQGKRALVTGGAQGIGAGICRGLAAAGASVAVVDCQIDKANQLAIEIAESGGMAFGVAADIASDEGCRHAVLAATEKLGGLNIVVNCAAPGRNKNVLGNLSNSDWDLHQQIVLNSAVVLADAATEQLAASGGGTILNISSVTSTSVMMDHCSWPYHVSKAGLEQLTRWLAVRLGGLGIRVNAVAPGHIDRDVSPKLTDNPQCKSVIEEIVPLRRAGSAQDIAQTVIFLCSEQSSYITGQVLTVDGGLGVHEVFSASLKAFKVGVGASAL